MLLTNMINIEGNKITSVQNVDSLKSSRIIFLPISLDTDETLLCSFHERQHLFKPFAA